MVTVMVMQLRLHELLTRSDVVLDGGVGVAHGGAQLGDRVAIA
jgi:hypothetical protein